MLSPGATPHLNQSGGSFVPLKHWPVACYTCQLWARPQSDSPDAVWRSRVKTARVPEVAGDQAGKPISRPACPSRWVCSPYRSVWRGLEAGRPCASHYHSTHTPPSPAPGTAPPPRICLHCLKTRVNFIESLETLCIKCNLYAVACSSNIQHCTPWTAASSSSRAAALRHILSLAMLSRNSEGSFCLSGVCFLAIRLRNLVSASICWSRFCPTSLASEHSRQSWQKYKKQ